MAAFKVKKVFYVAGEDLIALAGGMESGFVKPGMSIDLPREVKGPGWVPIHDTQSVPFRDGKTLLCILLLYDVVVGAPLMEFTDLEGLALEIRP
jgi:hypothetical protein